jgi:hypothetical protein
MCTTVHGKQTVVLYCNTIPLACRIEEHKPFPEPPSDGVVGGGGWGVEVNKNNPNNPRTPFPHRTGSAEPKSEETTLAPASSTQRIITTKHSTNRPTRYVANDGVAHGMLHICCRAVTKPVHHLQKCMQECTPVHEDGDEDGNEDGDGDRAGESTNIKLLYALYALYALRAPTSYTRPSPPTTTTPPPAPAPAPELMPILIPEGSQVW